jgi:Tat protein secretion system quality control protein TatD with DNase activity
MSTHLVKYLLIGLIFFMTHIANAQSSEELAKTVPIADVHRHVQKWMSVEKLKSEMESENISWAGAVGPTAGPWDTRPYVDQLGDRYINVLGQVELHKIFYDTGREALEDVNHPIYQSLFIEAEKKLALGEIKGFGELVLNNRRSNPNASFRRKIRIDSEPIRRIMAIANKHKAFVIIHSEADDDSVNQIKALASENPDASLILAHCLFTQRVDLIDTLLKEFPNIFCELSARNEGMYRDGHVRKYAEREGFIVFTRSHIDIPWKKLIETHPTRFMVGTDTYNSSVSGKLMISEIRNGLLKNLDSSVIPLVAFENAKRVMRLQ